MNYLIKDTTPEERQLIVEKALAISHSGAKAPSKEVLDLVYDSYCLSITSSNSTSKTRLE